MNKIKIAFLTSSRADFGIYLPLFKKINNDINFDLKIIAFGSHTSKYYGKTIYDIIDNGFKNIDKIDSLLEKDDKISISKSYALTISKFADYWNKNTYDIIVCIGDRFEMSAAVQAALPFNFNFAHIHGGETSLGAIDNIYRDQITLASKYHFTSNKFHQAKVARLLGSDKNVFCIGSLSLFETNKIKLIKEKDLRSFFNIPSGDYILATFHPETNSSNSIEFQAEQLYLSLKKTLKKINVVITSPNADTLGSSYKNILNKLEIMFPKNFKIVENFGKINYFSAIKYSKAVLGNSSSGIIEAATFNKFVINVGDRQKGRSRSKNIIDCNFKSDEIFNCVKEVILLGDFKGNNIYYKKNSVDNFIKIIRDLYSEKL